MFLVVLLGLSACSAEEEWVPDPIACPEGAEPEFIRFSDHRIATEGRELSELGWRCKLPSGDRHGLSKEWFSNRQVSATTEWWKGEKHGRFEMWYPNGQKRAEGAHDHWRAVGIWTQWTREGEIDVQRDFGAPPAAEGSDEPPAQPEAGQPLDSRSPAPPQHG